jgi:hypothetical protein
MDRESFAELCKSVAKHGIRQPVVTYQGMIVDGRHRARAGVLLGKPIPTTEWEGDDEAELIEFVADCNLRRRDLTPSQKACIAVSIKQRLEVVYAERRRAGKRIEEPCGKISTRYEKSRDEAAAKVGVNPRYVTDAERIQREAPEVFVEVKAGRLGIQEAKRRIAPQIHVAEPLRLECFLDDIERLARKYSDIKDRVDPSAIMDRIRRA